MKPGGQKCFPPRIRSREKGVFGLQKIAFQIRGLHPETLQNIATRAQRCNATRRNALQRITAAMPFIKAFMIANDGILRARRTLENLR